MTRLLQLAAFAAGAVASLDTYWPAYGTGSSYSWTGTAPSGFPTAPANSSSSSSSVVSPFSNSSSSSSTPSVTTSTGVTTYTTICTETSGGISNGTTSLTTYTETHTHSAPFTTTITLSSTIKSTVTVTPTTTVKSASSSTAGPASGSSSSTAGPASGSSSSAAGPSSYDSGSWGSSSVITTTYYSTYTTVITVTASASQGATTSPSTYVTTATSTSTIKSTVTVPASSSSPAGPASGSSSSAAGPASGSSSSPTGPASYDNSWGSATAVTTVIDYTTVEYTITSTIYTLTSTVTQGGQTYTSTYVSSGSAAAPVTTQTSAQSTTIPALTKAAQSTVSNSDSPFPSSLSSWLSGYSSWMSSASSVHHRHDGSSTASATGSSSSVAGPITSSAACTPSTITSLSTSLKTYTTTCSNSSLYWSGNATLTKYKNETHTHSEVLTSTITTVVGCGSATTKSTGSAKVTSSPVSGSGSASKSGTASVSASASSSAPYGQGNSSSVRPTGPTGTSTSKCALPTSPLTVEEQVGGGTWGTLCQPYFPKWLNGTNGKPYFEAPWGNATTENADATVLGDIPNTGVYRHYDLTISRGRISTDGVLRDVIMVNGQFPAPAIEANWGDWIEVTVHNKITAPEEGTSLHWHGMLQKATPWYDGVPAISQCPIAPGASYTYTFQAELYGTSWYHAHYSAQYTAGIAGPMIIHGPTQLDYDIDVGPVMVSDWHHIPYFSVVKDVVGTNLSLIPPFGDSVLINGRAQFDCSSSTYDQGDDYLGSNVLSDIKWTCVSGAERSVFKFQSGKTHRLRFVNHGSDGILKISIDGHQLTVIATDYVPTTPYTTSAITLGVGQRTDVLVTAKSDSKTSAWLRVSEYGGVACDNSPLPDSLAAIYYEDADTTADPTTTGNAVDQSCMNDAVSGTTPSYAIEPASSGVYVANIVLDLTLNATGAYEWQVNGQAFRADFNAPSLFLAAAGNVSYPYDPQWNVYNYGTNKSVILNVTNNTPVTHPFHMHGHNFYVLNVGPLGQSPGAGGVWDGSVVNAQNPMRRDTQIIGAFSYAAVQFEGDNPGIWPFHCHVAWHVSGGLSMNLMSRPGDIPAIPAGEKAKTCDAWYAYTNANVVDQIDSGS